MYRYAVLAGLTCTTSSVDPDNSRHFCSKRFEGRTVILPPPKVVSCLMPLYRRIFVAPPDCRARRSAPSAPLSTPLLLRKVVFGYPAWKHRLFQAICSTLAKQLQGDLNIP